MTIINKKLKNTCPVNLKGWFSMERLTKSTLKSLFYKYRHGLVLSYFFIYIIWFLALEKSVVTRYTSVHIWLDDYIPFNELFIIPYYMWFLFIAGVVLYLFFTSREDFYKCTAFLFIGMTICLVIYTIWPNGQNLRPTEFARDNILVDLVKKLYSADTNTNVCPSIHVFNSIGAYIAIANCSRLKEKLWIRYGAFILTVLICLSTVFLKQHSAFDGICAIILSTVMYVVVYVPDYSRIFRHLSGKYQLEN